MIYLTSKIDPSKIEISSPITPIIYMRSLITKLGKYLRGVIT